MCARAALLRTCTSSIHDIRISLKISQPMWRVNLMRRWLLYFFLSFFIYFGLSVFVYAREMQFCELAPNEWTEHLLSIDRKGEKGKKNMSKMRSTKTELRKWFCRRRRRRRRHGWVAVRLWVVCMTVYARSYLCAHCNMLSLTLPKLELKQMSKSKSQSNESNRITAEHSRFGATSNFNIIYSLQSSDEDDSVDYIRIRHLYVHCFTFLIIKIDFQNFHVT